MSGGCLRYSGLIFRSIAPVIEELHQVMDVDLAVSVEVGWTVLGAVRRRINTQRTTAKEQALMTLAFLGHEDDTVGAEAAGTFDGSFAPDLAAVDAGTAPTATRLFALGIAHLYAIGADATGTGLTGVDDHVSSALPVTCQRLGQIAAEMAVANLCRRNGIGIQSTAAIDRDVVQKLAVLDLEVEWIIAPSKGDTCTQPFSGVLDDLTVGQLD